MIDLRCGDCREIMAGLEPESIDAVVTDPPYELGFMGKSWDSSGVAFDPDTWRACLRVLKPGGHLLAFGGTRTFHRIAVAIEDAGFEIRDVVSWVYGSGFPKSLDVSKAIDASDIIGTSRERSLRFTEWMRSTGITATEIDAATKSFMASHYLTDKEQPAVATEDKFSTLRPIFAARGVEIPEWVEELVAWRTVESENLKKRKVVGERVMADMKKSRPVSIAAQGLEESGRRNVKITSAHTDDAKAWEGWGTALKPAWEPVIVARKPLIGTVAGNVLRYGTGAINIDGCRVNPGEAVPGGGSGRIGNFGGKTQSDADLSDYRQQAHNLGRWPANFIHDGSEEVVALFPDEEDVSAARFFYCAKASRADRDEGLAGEKRALNWSSGTKNPGSFQSPNTDRTARNFHPTVKPTDLMRYLVRLVTPPGGTVLDPFLGSGSTGKAARLEGFDFVGIEREPEYIEIARARIEYAEDVATGRTIPGEHPSQLDLFEEAQS